ncbi:MAG: hypothetical protein Q4B26_08975 [Eubacteriales bacterium]|nr:hypothetical protein [Eubacteriales bacterium]
MKELNSYEERMILVETMERDFARKEQLEKESLRYGNLNARADLWMRIFRGGMVFSAGLVMYAFIFTLMSHAVYAVLAVGVLLILLFGILERISAKRAKNFRKKKAEIREEYTEICDRIDRVNS